MKIKGKSISRPPETLVKFPRTNNEIVEFKITPVTNEKDFDKICPEPQPTRVIKPGGIDYIDTNDPVYKEKLEAREKMRWDWLLVESLRHTDGIEFEKVKFDDPTTWNLLKEELEESGLSRAEVFYLLNKIAEANIVTDEYLKAAEHRFFPQEASGK